MIPQASGLPLGCSLLCNAAAKLWQLQVCSAHPPITPWYPLVNSGRTAVTLPFIQTRVVYDTGARPNLVKARKEGMRPVRVEGARVVGYRRPSTETFSPPWRCFMVSPCLGVVRVYPKALFGRISFYGILVLGTSKVFFSPTKICDCCLGHTI